MNASVAEYLGEVFGKYKAAMEALEGRIKALELSLAQPTPDNPLLVRIERLERVTDGQPRRLEVLEQRVSSDLTRQERWHRTYNAALPEAIRQYFEASSDYEGKVHGLCAGHADRAHGPLEANYVTTGEIEAFKRGRETLDEKVTALVRAARELADEAAGVPVDALLAALKPFEGVS